MKDSLNIGHSAQPSDWWCQTKIVEQIIEGGANYIIAVKGNQPTLEKNIQDTITLTKPTSIDVQEHFGHGRIEKRTCSVFTNLNYLEGKDKWRNINSVIRITAEVVQKSSGRKTIEERFYISDIRSSSIINKGIRSHWSVENNLHWSLDVTFQEDTSKKRMGNQVENFNMLTKIVLSILKKDKSTKISLKNKRMKAAFDIKYRNNLNKVSGNIQLVIYNVMGKVVLNQTINKTEQIISIKTLDAGVYFYSISQNGSSIKTDKLMVK